MAGPGLTTAEIDTALDAVVPDAVSMHTASPGSTGANEVTGGSPAYARKTASPAAASASAKDLIGGTLAFDIPAGTTITHAGFWKAGVFIGGEQLSASETFAAQGVYDLTAASLAGTST